MNKRIESIIENHYGSDFNTIVSRNDMRCFLKELYLLALSDVYDRVTDENSFEEVIEQLRKENQ